GKAGFGQLRLVEVDDVDAAIERERQQAVFVLREAARVEQRLLHVGQISVGQGRLGVVVQRRNSAGLVPRRDVGFECLDEIGGTARDDRAGDLLLQLVAGIRREVETDGDV